MNDELKVYNRQKRIYCDATKEIEQINKSLPSDVINTSVSKLNEEDLYFPLSIDLEYKICISTGEYVADVWLTMHQDVIGDSFRRIHVSKIDTNHIYMREGYGSKLLKAAELIAKKFNIEVSGDVFLVSSSAQPFYEKNGYKIENGRFYKKP